MVAPYYSIVVPTRNRPNLFLQTVDSIVRQDFDDYEVIVSDNSSDSRTGDAFAALDFSSKFKYFRPEAELSMPDHWEFATLKATGQYVIILTDRSVLCVGALKRIHNALVGSEKLVEVCSWPWNTYDDDSQVLISLGTSGSAVWKKSSMVSQSFAGPQKNYPYELPRGLNSCYSAAIATSVRARYGRLFYPLSPDYHSAFLLLSMVAEILYINTPLFVSHGLTVSNGGTAYVSDAMPYLLSLGSVDWYAQVPIKAPLSESLIYQDYLDVANDFSGGWSADWVEYFVSNYRELLDKQAAGQIPNERMADFFAEWQRALREQNGVVRAQVSVGIGRLRRQRWLTKFVLYRAIEWIRRKLRGSSNVSRKYPSVMAAAGFIDAPLA